jgi:predicted dehydrogenase
LDKLGVGVIGAGRWAKSAHLPGFSRSSLCRVVAICDLNREQADLRAREFSIPYVYTDYHDLLSRNDIDVVDVCTRSGANDPDKHEALAFSALAAGKHCLCEKPVAHNYRKTWEAHELATKKGLKTKVGLTFRYAPAMMYMNELIKNGFIGEPFIFNGFEQNSQFLSPTDPVTKADLITSAVGSEITVSSLEGYGAPIIDLGMMFVGSDIVNVTGILKNFVPYRTNAEGKKVRTNVDDGDIFIGTYKNGAICSIQSSYVTVGNYPGLEARVYGSRGALICRLVEEFGNNQTLVSATPNAVEFRKVEIPKKFFPPGHYEGETWSSMYYTNLIHNFMEEITSNDVENQGNFAQSAKVQEVINAVAASHRLKSWIQLPLDPKFIKV